MSVVEQAYIEALKVELSQARNADHAAEVRAELARVGVVVEGVVERAQRAPQVEMAAAPKQRKVKA